MASSNNTLIFSTEGARALIARGFTYDAVRRFAQGIADYIAHKYLRSEKPSVAVGYDRRFMSDRFAMALAEILAANGINVAVSTSPVPTPALSLATSRGGYGLGIMVTASHNDYLYNGIKVKQEGRSAPANITAEIENYSSKAVPLKGIKTGIDRKDFLADYCEYIEKSYQPRKLLSRIKGKIVVDFMHGSAAEASKLLAAKNVIFLREKHDPLFGGMAPEPVPANIKDLVDAVKANKAVFGAALDGDGDKIAFVMENGVFLSSCKTAPLLLSHIIGKGKFNGKISQTVSMGYLTKRIAREARIPVEETPVGFKYVAEKMLHEGASFIAEDAGGYSWKGNEPETDGIVSLLLAAEIALSAKKPLSKVADSIEEKYGKSCYGRRDIDLPKIMANKHSFAVKVKKKLPKTILGKKIAETETADGLKIILDNDWWLLLRPSGTEQKMRAYAETDNKTDTNKLLDLACKLANVK